MQLRSVGESADKTFITATWHDPERAIGPIGRLHIHRPACRPTLPTLPCLILDSPLNLNFSTENQSTSRVRVLSDTKRHLNRAIFRAFMANWLGFIIIPIRLPHLERAKTKSKKPTVFYADFVSFPKSEFEFPPSPHLLPFPIGAPFPPKNTLPKRKRILSYLFNGLTIEQNPINPSSYPCIWRELNLPTYSTSSRIYRKVDMMLRTCTMRQKVTLLIWYYFRFLHSYFFFLFFIFSLIYLWRYHICDWFYCLVLAWLHLTWPDLTWLLLVAVWPIQWGYHVYNQLSFLLFSSTWSLSDLHRIVSAW